MPDSASASRMPDQLERRENQTLSSSPGNGSEFSRSKPLAKPPCAGLHRETDEAPSPEGYPQISVGCRNFQGPTHQMGRLCSFEIVSALSEHPRLQARENCQALPVCTSKRARLWPRLSPFVDLPILGKALHKLPAPEDRPFRKVAHPAA